MNCGRSYVDSTDWIKSKKATANSINKKDKCLHYAVTIALNHEWIKRDPQKRAKINLFINKYNWEGIHFPSTKMTKKWEK